MTGGGKARSKRGAITAPEAGPAISVLMPVRNGAAYLDAALASLAAQSFADFEIVVVDNGSSDGTAAILAEWQEREPRLRVARFERPRLAATLNLAASLARGPLLARLDADDLARPGRLARQFRVFRAHPELQLLGSAAVLIDPRGRWCGKLRPPLTRNGIRERQRISSGLIPSSTMMRAAAFDAVGGYREGLNVSEDYDLWTRIAERFVVANLPDVLIDYRIHDDSITARQPVRMALASLCVSAAAKARLTGAEEPFIRGVPALRLALPLLGMSRAAARRVVRLRSIVNLLSRRWRMLPLPGFVKVLPLRLARGLGLQSLYTHWLEARHGLRKRRRGVSPGRTRTARP
ncbi:MAG: glycosyltransferase family 2 protein [Sphingomonadales bacterium]